MLHDARGRLIYREVIRLFFGFRAPVQGGQVGSSDSAKRMLILKSLGNGAELAAMLEESGYGAGLRAWTQPVAP